MRARAGDPPRTMAQKILAGRAVDAAAGASGPIEGDLLGVKLDQIVLSAAPGRALSHAVAAGMRGSSVEVAIAYDGVCVTSRMPGSAGLSGTAPTSPASLGSMGSASLNMMGSASLTEAALRQLTSSGIQVARAGLGFAPCVHLERFAAPARLAVTDDPRLAMLGGIGMLVLTLPPDQLGVALARGVVQVRSPRIVQVLLSGRLRAFVSARDVGLELVRRGLDEVVRGIDARHDAPVILEFAGAGARLLNITERAQIAAIAPLVGAQAALFVSDEKTETYLRDQRRSKAHRALFADQGAPSDHVLSLDLAAVDPLILDVDGVARFVRDLAGRPVHQAMLGGDGGAGLRDLLVAAGLLKSKRVPSTLELLLAPPSRQCLEVLAQSGALADLIATGARIIEPDRRVSSGELYPAGPGRTSLRTCDAAPGGAPFLVASAETVCLAVASGEIGDPRSFKRPVRVTVPRVLPTDDVLILKESKRASASPVEPIEAAEPPPRAWLAPLTLRLSLFDAPSSGGVEGAHVSERLGISERTKNDPARLAESTSPHGSREPVMIVARGLLDVLALCDTLALGRGGPTVLVAAFIPAALSTLFSGQGVVALIASDDDLAHLVKHAASSPSVELPPLDALVSPCEIPLAGQRITLRWATRPAERARWASSEGSSDVQTARASKTPRKKSVAS